MVREEFQKKPSFLPYLVSISRKPPGLLRLTYCKRGDVLHEYAELRPAGILYDQRIFHHVESFVAYFKKNIKRIVGKGEEYECSTPRKCSRRELPLIRGRRRNPRCTTDDRRWTIARCTASSPQCTSSLLTVMAILLFVPNSFSVDLSNLVSALFSVHCHGKQVAVSATIQAKNVDNRRF